MLGRTGPHGARTDYELVELLPQTGGQAFVFRGVLHGDRLGPGTDGMQVAVKQLITGAIGTAETAEVVEVLCQRAHPYLSRMLEVFTGPAPDPAGSAGDDDTLVYVASEWIPGCSADAAAATASLGEIMRWVTEIAGAVDYLHAPGQIGGPVCHRDIKPANVIVDPDGDAILIDPGLARLGAGVGSGSPHGSPGFIPPECVTDPRASGPAGDRWQVGALLYALLVGEAPGRDNAERLRSRLRAVRRWHLPPSFVEGVITMLHPEPAHRPSSAQRWALDLAERRLASRGRLPAPPMPGRRALVGVVAVLALFASGTAGWLAHRQAAPAAAAATTDPPPAHLLPIDSVVHMPRGDGRTVTVFNEVTIGATAMRQDDTPAYLSLVPDTYCADHGCEVAGTDMDTGVLLTAVCQTVGESTTNGDDQDGLDARNPGRFTTNRYYGIRAPGDAFGYLSFVWVAPVDRSGFGLRECSATLR